MTTCNGLNKDTDRLKKKTDGNKKVRNIYIYIYRRAVPRVDETQIAKEFTCGTRCAQASRGRRKLLPSLLAIPRGLVVLHESQDITGPVEALMAQEMTRSILWAEHSSRPDTQWVFRCRRARHRLDLACYSSLDSTSGPKSVVPSFR